MSTVDKVDVAAGHGAAVIHPGEVVVEAEVKARGYWELVWIRFRRDKVAVASGIFAIFLLIAAFGLAPLFKIWLGHGPNEIFANGFDFNSGKPVGPWTYINTAPYPGAAGHYGTQLLPLGADGSLGRDLFLRLLYGARTSMEVAI